VNPFQISKGHLILKNHSLASWIKKKDHLNVVINSNEIPYLENEIGVVLKFDYVLNKCSEFYLSRYKSKKLFMFFINSLILYTIIYLLLDNFSDPNWYGIVFLLSLIHNTLYYTASRGFKGVLNDLDKRITSKEIILKEDQ
jgi:hypothetical protein